MTHARALYVALAISILFHLSMVTVFRIVIAFPRENIEYVSFRIVAPAQRPAQLQAHSADRLRVPSPNATPAGLVGGDAEETDPGWQEPLWDLPAIELPTVEFAELRRLRVREEGLALWTEHEALLGPKPRDAWARFGEELGQLGSALSHLRLSGREDQDKEVAPEPVSRPAKGFEAYIEWVTEPRDRQLLFAPPIEALWGMAPSEMAAPIVLQFTVNTSGRVVSVWSPGLDDDGVTRSAQNALLKYRFEPVDGNAKQQATLHIVASRTEP